MTPDFVLQSLTILVPAIVTIVVTTKKQNAKIATIQGKILVLEKENDDLKKDNEELRSRFDRLSSAHTDLQQRYEATLKAQANMRGRF